MPDPWDRGYRQKPRDPGCRDIGIKEDGGSISKRERADAFRKTGLVYAFSSAGHRGPYLRFLESSLGLAPVSNRFGLSVGWQLLRAKRLLFATISGGNAPQAMLIALLRAILGKRTTAICMSAGWYSDRRHRARSAIALGIFRLLHALGRLDLFCIVPYKLMPVVRKTTSDWILDLFLWNSPAETSAVSEQQSQLVERIREVAAGRVVLLYAGKATRRKRFEHLVVLAEQVGSQVLIVAAGSVDEESREDAGKLKDLNMVVFNRFVTDEEMLSLFGVADYVWCCYDENQLSSGIFGLAVQWQKKAIVRQDSYLDRLAQLLQHPVCYDLRQDLASAGSRNQLSHDDETARMDNAEGMLASMANMSLEKLRSSLRLPGSSQC